MAYTKNYPTGWENYPSTNTPITAETLDNIEDGIVNLDTNKQNALVSGSTIKTINNTSVLGSGNISVGAPDVATGDEINTGTNNTKMVSPKSIEDSNLIRSTNNSIIDIIALTKAQYNLLTPLEKTGRLFNITDDEGSSPSGGLTVVSVSTSTGASTVAKVGVGPTGYTPTAGDIIALTLTIANTANSPTLNINGSGAKNIRIGGTNATASVFKNGANGTVYLIYDGSYYNMFGANMSTDANTTYSVISETNIVNASSTTEGLITGARAEYLLQNRLKTVNGSSLVGTGDLVTPDTTYSEISDTEITAGTGTTSRTITGRRAKKIIDNARDNLISSNTNGQVTSIFVGTTAQYNALSNKTGILAIIEE